MDAKLKADLTAYPMKEDIYNYPAPTPLELVSDVSPRSVEARVGLIASPSRFSRNRGKKLLLKWQWNTCAVIHIIKT